MREGSDFDEIDEDVHDRLFSLDEILSESEVEEVESGEKTISKEERDELLQEVHSSLLSESERDELVREGLRVVSPKTGEEIDPKEVCRLYLEEGLSMKKVGEHFGFKNGGRAMKRILTAHGVKIRPVGFQEIEIDHDEAYRLYFEEKWDLKEVAAHFGCKSTDPIHRVFKENGWKTRQQISYQKEIDPEEVFRLYNEEKLSHRKIGALYGVSDGPIRRIFKEHGMPYGQEVQVDPTELHYLYFELGLSKEKTCEALGISRTPFDRVLKEQGWDARSAGFQPIEIDIDDLRKLYISEELTLKETARRLGISTRTLTRFFENHNLERRTSPKVEIDLDELSNLYYDDRLTLREIAEHLELSKHTLARIISDFELEVRKVRSVRELRDDIFGTECVLCGDPSELIHRKDGTPHTSDVLWTRKSLLNLDPNDWAALCEDCHRSTHALMKSYSFEWAQIEKMIRTNLDCNDS